MTLSDDLEHIAEHIGDDQPNLPEGAKNSLLLAAKALRKLPHTADGVPVVPGMEVWLWMRSDTMPATVCDVEMYAEILSDINGYGYPVRQCYSTRKAAEKASKV